MNKIYKFYDRAWGCYGCSTKSIPETDIQLALGRCPVCGEFDYLYMLNYEVPIYAIDKEYYRRGTGFTYTIREPYYPTPEQKQRLQYNYCINN